MKKIIEEEFIRICNESVSATEAAIKLNMHFNTFKRYALQLNCYKPNQGCKGIKHGHTAARIKTQDILNGKYPQYQTSKLKKRLLEEGYKEYKCECCNNSEWNNQPIPLELHHKDGNPHNHNLDNLELLCLNCHAQTDNFRSKNRSKNRK